MFDFVAWCIFVFSPIILFIDAFNKPFAFVIWKLCFFYYFVCVRAFMLEMKSLSVISWNELINTFVIELSLIDHFHLICIYLSFASNMCNMLLLRCIYSYIRYMQTIASSTHTHSMRHNFFFLNFHIVHLM